MTHCGRGARRSSSIYLRDPQGHPGYCEGLRQPL